MSVTVSWEWYLFYVVELSEELIIHTGVYVCPQLLQVLMADPT